MEEVTMGEIPSSMREPLRGSAGERECLPVGSHDGTDPVEGIGSTGVVDAVEGNLTADKVDEKGNNGPESSFTERNLAMIRDRPRTSTEGRLGEGDIPFWRDP